MTLRAFNNATQSEPYLAVPVVGKIVAVEGAQPLPTGGVGYYSSNTYYTIQTSLPGNGVMSLTKQRPEIRLWSHGEVLLDAEYLIGKSVQGVFIANEVRWNFIEPPAFATCGAAPGAAGEPIIDPNRRGVVSRRGIDLPPIDGDPGNAAGGSGSGATGTTDGGIT